ncbi:MAG TPA: coenzyme F420-0:L-glutamate ligase [Ktedonobacterales bacterium]|nr:coenzyme F420-0:L-glutamate ligase [Ktedonobacterales bacterium]
MSAATPQPALQIFGVDGIPDVRPGDDVAAMILDAAATTTPLQAGDVLVITHKVVSKAEGQLVDMRTVEPSPLAIEWAQTWDRDPRQIEVALRESKRIVRMDRGVLICETRHGFICANAGVDASNVAGDDTLCLLPHDPDASARHIATVAAERLGFAVPIIISDSFGRPWRFGIVNIAIGVAGLLPLSDYRGQTDPYGRELHVSILAVADELASAAELVMNKIDRRPVAIIRGYPWQPGDGKASELIIDPARDLFR